MYCTIADINNILIVDYFKGHAVPPENQMESQADIIAGDLDGTLALCGYRATPEIGTPLYRYIASANAMGVAAWWASRIFPMQSQNKNEFQTRYDNMIKRLIDKSWIDYVTDSQITDVREW